MLLESVSLIEDSKNQDGYNSIKEKKQLFDKYEIKSAEQLEKIKNILPGALIITTDSKHIGIHKAFYTMQIIKRTFAKIGGGCKKKKPKPIDPNLCHAMIAIGWDNEKNRPVLAHSIMDGVKINAVDYFQPIKYFGRKYKTADGMVVYVPRKECFRKELLKNAELSARISTEKKNRSPFSWGNLLGCIFKKQIYKIPLKTAQEDLAYAVTDLLLKRKLSPGSKENKARALFCIEYAVCILQASILTKALSEQEKNELLGDNDNPSSRLEIAKEIYRRISQPKNKEDSISKAYWKFKICHQVNPKGIISSYAALILNKTSCLKNVEDD